MGLFLEFPLKSPLNLNLRKPVSHHIIISCYDRIDSFTQLYMQAPLESAIWMNDTFSYNFGIENDFEKC